MKTIEELDERLSAVYAEVMSVRTDMAVIYEAEENNIKVIMLDLIGKQITDIQQMIEDEIQEAQKVYRDDAHIDGKTKYYTRKEAVDIIREILKSDDDIRKGRDVDSMSDNTLLEIGYAWYSIYKE